MGERGPVPKRSNQRRRRNKPDGGGEITTAETGAPTRTQAPPADEDWHPIARRWYESLAASGQTRFYEPSDWATAYLLAESISRDLKPQFVGVNGEGEAIIKTIPLKGTSLSAYLKAMNALLVTEGDRRRARLELERGTAADEDEEAAVVDLDAYQRRVSG